MKKDNNFENSDMRGKLKEQLIIKSLKVQLMKTEMSKIKCNVNMNIVMKNLCWSTFDNTNTDLHKKRLSMNINL